MRLRFTPRAVQNLAAIADYICAHDPVAAQQVRAAIYASFQRLIIFPSIGRLQQAKGVRKLTTPKYPYLIYYTIDEGAEEIIILNVKHAAQRREHTDA
ncbi:type II toxin-antitoxin system RelE/ParE family toxin [Methylocapsa polymorpha]|uniref:Type II toxin-antitoxin system RelE/ParE family toxin n=1 Tax=Methylocapsa polymorpha TaxID=3080828 RepID=A0ABZ0HR16_9HYPH|nr:type II toxin-antitoxin system RelE/ParE family toxin [Methylocapsa sp. RX1]